MILENEFTELAAAERGYQISHHHRGVMVVRNSRTAFRSVVEAEGLEGQSARPPGQPD
jgi:hypothetical protein